MGQVPQGSSYLIIGDGRVARHFQHYLKLEGLPFKTWNRKSVGSQKPLSELAREATHALVLISDSAIESFLSENPVLQKLTTTHFSGALSLSQIPSAHPLMTFADDQLYELEQYRQIPFVLEKGRGSMAELLPGLQNPARAIESSQKPLYHALCVFSGNFSILLWEKTFREFSEKLGLEKEILAPYLKQIAANLVAAEPGVSVLTGPLVRNDHSTIQKHLVQLGNDPYADVYRSFVLAYEKSTQLQELPKDAKESR